MLAEATWRRFLPFLCGPFIHKFWPSSSILKKPKLQIMLKWFNVFQEVWKGFRHNIPALQATISPENLDHFHNICDFFETYLPVVLWFENTKHINNFGLRKQFVLLHLVLLSSLNCAPYVKVCFYFFFNYFLI